MPKIKFRDPKLGAKRKDLLATVASVVENYQSQGYKLTLRQLYYQLVAKGLVENSMESYKRIGRLMTDSRYGGIVDWNAIEDRVRVPKLPYWAVDIPDALQDTVNSFRLDRQRNQSNYVEVWVEKDALSSVLGRVTSKYHVRLMVNRGYSSASAMYSAYKRFSRALRNGASQTTILYFGDHDPSGLDMIRDIDDRMKEMLEVDGYQHDIEVKQIALNMEQIKQYNPPPNPAKTTDRRAKEYIEKYGTESWELDALSPKVLNDLCTEAIEDEIDVELYLSVIEEEEGMKGKLIKFRNSFDK